MGESVGSGWGWGATLYNKKALLLQTCSGMLPHFQNPNLKKMGTEIATVHACVLLFL